MNRAQKHFTSFFILGLTLLLCAPAAHAEDTLPPMVRAQVKAPLAEIGTGTYRKFGFSVYRATLWAPGGVWDATKPYALELHYTRDVDKQTLVDTVADDIREQNVADAPTLARWQKTLDAALPAVADGDTITGVAIPGKPSQLFYNGKKTASIADADFSRAFFAIWLGETADADLRAKLLGKAP